MKKVLSMVLCLAMLASLLFALPVSAVTNSDPYLLNDFENGSIGMAGNVNHHKVELVTGGAFGSAYAARVTTDSNQTGSTLYKYGTGGTFSFDAHKGDVLMASMLIKSETEHASNSKGQCSLILWSDLYVDTNNYQFVVADFDKAEKGWQKVTFSYTFPKDVVDDTTTGINEGVRNMELRMNGPAETNKAADGTTNCSYLIDDLEIYLKKYDGSTKHASSFEDGENVKIVTNGDSYIAENVKTEAHTGSKSTMITVKNAENMYNVGAGLRNNGSHLNIAVNDGMTISVSAYVKLHQPLAASSNGRIAIMTYISPLVDFGGDGTATDNYKFFIVQVPDVTNTTDWQKVSTTFAWQYGETTLTSWELRLDNSNVLPGCTSSSPGERKFYIDDMTIEAKYSSENGCKFGFEKDETTRLNTNTGNYTTAIDDTEKHSGERSSLVTVANKANMYNVGAGFTNNGSHLNIPVKNGDTVSVSAYVKLYQPLAAASNGRIAIMTYIAPLVDFGGDGTATDNYKFFIVQIPDVTNTTDWQKVSTTFDWQYGQTTLTSWELRLDNSNVLPGCTSSSPGERKFYIDDININVANAAVTRPTAPVISNVRETGSFKVGDSAGVEYDIDIAGSGTDASVIKLMSGNGTIGDCVAKLTPGEKITVTEDMLGKNYYWEIIPKSSTGYIGEKVTHLATKPEFADIKIYNFEDGDTLNITGATVTNSGSLGTKGLSVTADSVTIDTVIDPDFDYSVSAKVKSSSVPTASFGMSDGDTFANSAMTVTALGNNWYSLTLDKYNFNTANSSSYMASQIETNAKITFGASANYVLDDVILMPYTMTEIAGTNVTLPASAQIFDTVNATVSKAASVFYVFEVSADSTNWTTVASGATSKATIPYFMDAVMADKKLRVTIYTDGVSYEYKTSNTLAEDTNEIVSTEIKITNSKGEEVKDVTDAFLTATATVYNPFDDTKEVTLYNAAYTNVPYKLAYLRPYSVSAPKGITVVTDTIDLTDVSHYSMYTHFLKTFLWNGYTPLTDAKETQAVELIDGAVYNMYIDPSIDTVEGIVMMNQHGESGLYATSTNFRNFCKERNLAIFDFYDGSDGQLKTFQDEEFAMNVLNTKIAEFAQTTGHPELNYVPIATLGHSNGCVSAGKIAKLNPERTFAVLCFKSANGAQFEYDELVEAGVPVFIVTGEVDWDWGFHDQIHAAERMVAAGGAVTYLQHPGGGHGNMSAVEDIMLAFLDEAYKAKVKNATIENGVLVMPETDIENGYIGYGDYTETVESKWNNDAKDYVDKTVYVYTNPQYMTYAEYKTQPAGFKAQAWLFNESFAQKWANFVRAGSIN